MKWERITSNKQMACGILSALILAAALASGAQAATFTVTNTDDSGFGSLRLAMDDANINPGLDTIEFDIPGVGPYTIAPQSALPSVTDPVVIDGTTQPGFAGSPIVEINATNLSNGMVVEAGNSTIRGLVVNRATANGIALITNGGNVIEGCYIGTNIDGTIAHPNGQSGIRVALGSSGNTIGGLTAAARNVISGNGLWGLILVGSNDLTGTVILGNYIGTAANGTDPLGNQDGIEISGAPNTVVGGTILGSRNVISGNARWGIRSFGSSGVMILGNYVGVSSDGTLPLGNLLGVLVQNSAGNTIGGTSVDLRNVISGNTGIGIQVTGASATGNKIQGNYIGTNANGNLAVGNGNRGVVI